MRPVLFELGGLEVQSYGLSKALAAIAAGWLLARELRRRGHDGELAVPLVLAAVIAGFAGAKLYYLLEVGGRLSLHDLGGTGFTWYGGLIGGAAAVLVVAWRRGLGLGSLAGMSAVPLAVAYGIGRIGCELAGDGTYGKPSDLPWAHSYPDGTMPTTERVHPAAVYEALTAFLAAWVLWRLRDRLSLVAQFGLFAVLMGASRFLVEFVRINDVVAGGLTAAQWFSLALIALGAGLLAREVRRERLLGAPGRA
jgi:phosphatidylglycerol:prolipoprotein diacylglycerol transferase